MVPPVQLDSEAMEVLSALQLQADARHQSLASYLRMLASPNMLTPSRPMTADEFERELDKLAAEADDSPLLPADFSRADIYLDHD